ncbi:hypothetical protein ACFL0W_06250 [Nanoarchaeota archaeon]
MDDNKEQETPSCCQPIAKKDKEDKGFLSGLLYGLLPHTGCIVFIIFTIIGATAATSLLKPLMLNAYFFYILMGLSFVFATVSAYIYLRRFGLISLAGIKKKWKYLSVLYGTSIAINLLLFMIIFPLAANMASATPTGAITAGSLSEITLKVKIPCPGHAPLITNELKTISGVQTVKFSFPNYFDVSYDNSITNQKEILSLDVFNTYAATKVAGDSEAQAVSSAPAPTGCSNCGGCSGACGGTCTI